MKQWQSKSLQEIRDEYIKRMDRAENSTELSRHIADDLFNLGLTVYSNKFSFKSLIYNAFAQSFLDDRISLHPEQIQVINLICQKDALIISAPTSFGKTFCIFEYIVRKKPKNIVLVVPTLALVEEYIKKIVKNYKDKISEYNVFTQIDEEATYDFDGNNIFVLTHDRVVAEDIHNIIKHIDFLVIDEVYKLETDINNDRVLVLNMAYYYLSKVAEKYVLLAPFIENIENIDKLEKKPFFYKTNFSPVFNDVIEKEIINEGDRFSTCQKLSQMIAFEDKVLIYFPSVTRINKYIDDFIEKEPCIDIQNEEVINFLSWAKDEIHEKWSVVRALEKGYLVHNGQIPLGTRMYQLHLFETDEQFNRLLCTSTLLEGVNTCAKYLIVSQAGIQMEKNAYKQFSAFDFFNLVGRTGRLNKHFVGITYHIVSIEDRKYKKEEALKTVKFEIVDENNSRDVNIQTGDVLNDLEFSNLLIKLGITSEEYKVHIGSHFRFLTVKEIYNRFMKNKENLKNILLPLFTGIHKNYYYLIKELYSISNGNNGRIEISIINYLIKIRRVKIRNIVELVLKNHPNQEDYIISTVIRLKNGYLEHQFYNKVKIIKYFMEKDEDLSMFAVILDECVLNPIEDIYYTKSKKKKMLLDIGIYEMDVDRISEIIGEKYIDITSMKEALLQNKDKILSNNRISFISKYIIRYL